MTKKKTKNPKPGKNKDKKYEKAVSLYPLKAEEALSLFMKVDPKRVEIAD